MFDFLNLDFIPDYSIFGNSLVDYFKALLVFLIALIVLKVFKTIIIARFKKIALKTVTDFDDAVVAMLEYISWPFYLLISIYIGLRYLSLPELIDRIINGVFLVIIVYYVVKMISMLVDYIAKNALLKDQEDDTRDNQTVISVISKIVKIGLWATALILLLSNFGYNVTSLVAGLGIGGIAIALAAQNVLSDLFSSISIYFDKPFKIGDFIVAGKEKGTVKRIGIKTTRIQSVNGEELIISNQDLTNARVQNFKTMEKRRTTFLLGVTYETPKAKLEKIPLMIEGIIKKVKGTEVERVHFKTFGDSSLIFEVVYLVDTIEYVKFLDIQQEINFAIIAEFEKEKIEFAYPTQTIFVKK
ncbi:mechanosensitive ion channel family protein [bacterium]|jgi:small-conductance mechanosensitive channel|nr:mechanosensitive ion channel family protein [bacterium]MBT4495335.1 mechanosensitive ion channel family protein [bacterium]MBT4763747.1 mechanosensitive ion channel family protein [bacterium]MBT5401117.1 mechanosensitive ion channel family protein [bacterium]MBT5942923.1 mechanosensitive ion channel family protein [bacterium]